MLTFSPRSFLLASALFGCIGCYTRPPQEGTWCGSISHITIMDRNGGLHAAPVLMIESGPEPRPMKVKMAAEYHWHFPPPLLIDPKTNVILDPTSLPVGERVEVTGAFKGWSTYVPGKLEASRYRTKPGAGWDVESAIRVKRLVPLPAL